MVVLKLKSKKKQICHYLKDTCPSELLMDWCIEIEHRECPRKNIKEVKR